MLDHIVRDRDRRGLLNILCKICSRQRMIPKSMHIGNYLNREPVEVYAGGYANIFRGEHKGRPVAIKIIRLYQTSDSAKCFSVSTVIPYPTQVAINGEVPGILPGSRRMEAPSTPERLTSAGCESRAAPLRHDIRMDG